MRIQRIILGFLAGSITITLVILGAGLMGCSTQQPNTNTEVNTEELVRTGTATPTIKAVPETPAPQNLSEQDTENSLPPGVVLPHTFWGLVKTVEGKPGSGVEIEARVNGTLQTVSIISDDAGKFGGDMLVEFPEALSVTGHHGDIIEFIVDGCSARASRLGVLVEEDGEYYWDWQELPAEWQAVFNSGEHNGIELVYMPYR